MIIHLLYASILHTTVVLAVGSQSVPDLATSQQTAMNQTIQNWQSTRLQSISGQINTDTTTVSTKTALSTMQSFVDTLVNPLVGDAFNTIHDALATSEPVPTSIVTTLNDTTDIVAATLPAIQVQFSSVAATPITFDTTNLGSYTTPGSNYATFLS